MSDPRQQLAFALEKYPEQVDVVPIEKLVLESARQNPKRPAYLKVAVPDELVKAIRGSRDDRDLVLLVRVDQGVLKRAESPIVLPREVR